MFIACIIDIIKYIYSIMDISYSCAYKGNMRIFLFLREQWAET